MVNETQMVAMKVGFMSEPEARFISLVKRGANKTPFRAVKTDKEEPMKILQSIIAAKGTDVEAIKAALGETADIAKLAAPVEAGSFVSFEQAPREAFKSDSFKVVSLNEDKSILGIQGEILEKPEGLLATLLKPAKKSEQVIQLSDDLEVVSPDALKSQLGDKMWSESSAMTDAIRGILGQESGTGEEKIALVRIVLDNFLNSLSLSAAMLNGELMLGLPEAAAKSAAPAPIAEKAHVEDVAPKPAETAPVSADDTLKSEKLVEASVAEVKKGFEEKIEALGKALATAQEEIVKMQKTPVGVVTNPGDSEVVVPGTVKKSDGDVFKGIFHGLRR